MANHTKPYYTNTYYLSSLVQSQQHIPHKYDTRDYFGGCMRIQERNSESFLNDFINGTAIVLPEHYDLVENLLFILRKSGYKPIKKLLPKAIKKFDIMLIAQRERIAAANSVKPTNLNTPNQGSSKFAILDNKKKMLKMSCSDICELGDAINNERGFNTTKIKNKFASIVSYRIELVLIGKIPIDSDFTILLKKYGTPQQIKLYTNIINNRVAAHRQGQIQTISQSQKKKQPIQQPKPRTTKIVKTVTKPQPIQSAPVTKKSGNGFFKKMGQSVKKVFNQVKKPLIIGGMFALSIFGGKRAYDAIVENDALQQTEYNINNTPKTTVTESVDSVQHANKTVTTPSNEIIKNTVKQLQYLKDNNPTDKNMDVTQVANRLYQKFGENTYNVVLVSAMTPYALNDYTQFDFRPTTHNMIEHFSTSELTTTQKTALNEFISQHVKNNSINMNAFMQNQR